jgi:hypothetical protein
MEPEGSLLHSQELTTCPYPEPDQSSLCPLPSHFSKIHCNNILPSTPRSSKWSPSLRFPHWNPASTLLSWYVLHTPPILYRRLVRIRVSCNLFVTWLSFYGEEYLTPRPKPKLENHPLSAVRSYLFNIFPATLLIWRSFLHPQSEDAPCRGDRDPLITVTVTHLPLWQGPTYQLQLCSRSLVIPFSVQKCEG